MKAMPREHGTLRGYRQHWYRGERPCQPCRDAANAATKARRRARRVERGLPIGRERLPREHGTVRGYGQHRTRGEEACRPCLVAAAGDEKARRDRDPEFRAKRQQYIAAHGRVLTRLAEKYPDEMAALLAEELGYEGQPYKWKKTA